MIALFLPRWVPGTAVILTAQWDGWLITAEYLVGDQILVTGCCSDCGSLMTSKTVDLSEGSPGAYLPVTALTHDCTNE